MSGKPVLLVTLLVLSACGHDRNQPDATGFTPLMHAAAANDTKKIESLIDRGADPNYQGRTIYRWQLLSKQREVVDVPHRQWTPLAVAAGEGHLDAVRLLLHRGAHVNFETADGTALAFAVRGGHTGVVRALLGAGSTTDSGRGVQTPLLEAVRRGRNDIVKLLIDAKAGSPFQYDAETAMLEALAKGHVSTIRVLYDTGRIHLRQTAGRERQEALLDAIGHGHVDAARIPPRSVPYFRKLAPERAETLVGAIGRGDPNLPQLMKQSGIAPSDPLASEVLAAAAAAGHPQLLATLAREGVDVAARDRDEMTPLIHAVLANRPESVVALIAAGASVNQPGRRGMTPLMYAASDGAADTAKLLLSRGAKVDAKDERSWTALMFAAQTKKEPMVALLREAGASTRGLQSLELAGAVEAGDVARVKALLGAGADPGIAKAEGTPLLNVAIKQKRVDLLKMLLDAGASPDVNIGRMNYTPLRLAATTRNLDAIRLLLAARANVESPDDQGSTALMKALVSASPEMARILVAAGADVNAKTKWNQTPLKEMIRWAGQSRDKEANAAILRLLRQCGATESGERRPLVEAAAAGRVDRIDTLVLSHDRRERQHALVAAAATRQVAAARRLLAAHVSPDATDYEGNTALMAASESGSAEIAQILLDAKAGLDAKNRAGATALQLAAENGHGAVVQLLRARGAAGEVSAGGLEKALIDAAKKGEVDRVKALAAAGARLHWRKNEYGYEKPALHAAAEAGQAAVVAELVRAGAKVDEKVKVHYTSDTPLRYAVFGGSPETVRTLISLGADVNCVNERDDTPLRTAKGLAEVNYLEKRGKYQEIVRILEQAGAREAPARE